MVATPIGNLGDITARAVEILRAVPFVAAEDTRVTGRLLSHFGISTTTFSLHEHNERTVTKRVLTLLQEGNDIALVSDAGTPCISDPGTQVVSAARDAGFDVVPIPGPNAAITLLSAAGLLSPRFLFVGFLPAKPSARRSELTSLATFPWTLVFYETPHRIKDVIADMVGVLGEDRQLVLGRELTKMYEQIHVCPLGEALQWLEGDSDRVRGEMVLLVSGKPEIALDGPSEDHLRILRILMDALPPSQAASLAAQITGVRRKLLYEHALALQMGKD